MRDIILDYVIQHSEIIGIKLSQVETNFIDHYLRSDKGCLYEDFYKILVFFDQNPPPNEILNELKLQINTINMVHITQSITIYIDSFNEGVMPEFFVDMFKYFKKYGYEAHGDYFVKEMRDIFESLL